MFRRSSNIVAVMLIALVVMSRLLLAEAKPPTVQAGQSYPVSVTMKNAGTNTWPTDGSYALNSQNPTNNAWWHVQLVNPPAAIPPGQVTFNFNAVAPGVPGLHHFQWQMLHQGSALFGDLTPDVLVNVAPFTFTGDTTALSLSILDGAPDGGPAETLFTLTPLGGFTGNVALTLSYLDTSGNLVSGAPGGMDYWFDPATDADPMTGQVAIPDANPQDCLLSICPCAGNPVAGTYTLVITATSGTTTLTQNVTLTITP